jgi:hypothetical protein
MSAKKGGSMDFVFSRVMPFVYGIGAAIVIVGAMFNLCTGKALTPCLLSV